MYSDICINFLISVILSKYFNHTRCLFIFGDDYIDDLPYITENTYVRIKIHEIGNLSMIFNNYGCQGFIISAIEPHLILKDLEKQLRQTNERFNFRRYLILSTAANSQQVTKISYLEELHYISDMLFIMIPQIHGISVRLLDQFFCGKSYDLLTHKYDGNSDYKRLIPIDKWFTNNKSFLLGNNLFPDKITQQFGRNLRMATFTYEPYSVIGNEYQGSEMSLMLLYAEIHNMTPVIITDEYEWGEVYTNWTGNGILGNLVEDKADVGFAALYTWETYYHYLDISKPLIRTGITLLVPAPSLLSGWLTPVLAFSWTLWIALLVTYIITVMALIAILQLFRGKQSRIISLNETFLMSAMYVGKLTLSQPLTEQETRKSRGANYLFSIVHVTGLLVSSTYSSGLATIMTIPRYENAINTVEDFAKSTINWGATSDAWITSIQNSSEPEYISIVNRFVVADAATLRNMSEMEFAFSIERLPYGSFAVGKYIQRNVIEKFHLMERDLYWEHCVMMTRKNSVLLPSIDMHILRVAQAGLVSYWQTKAVTSSMDPAVQKAVSEKASHYDNARDIFSALAYTDVVGAFAVFCIGSCLSVFSFLMEISTNINYTKL